MLHYILVLAATILLAFDFALSKKYQASEGTALTAGLKFNALNGLLTAVIFFVLSGFKTDVSLFSLLFALAMSTCCALYSIIGFRILRTGNMAVYSLFLMSGGMLLPYFFGVLFLEESLSVFRVGGVLLILLAVILSNRSGSGQSLQKKLYLLCVAIFLLNGMVSIISKCHQIDTTHNAIDSTAFVALTGLTRFAVCSLTLLLTKPNRRQLSFTSRKTFGIILCSALIGGVSYMLQLIGAKELPATVLYPLVTGGSIIFSAFAGKAFFKEKITKAQWISILLCFIGTFLFL